MPKLTKKLVESAEPRSTDYFLWDEQAPGFGVRVYPSGKRFYLVQYRAGGRTRRAKIGLHGPITCEEARKEALALLGQVAKGGDPAEEKATRRRSMTVKELCDRYRKAADQGLIMGKRGQPKKLLTMASDIGRINAHIVPLLGNRKVRDLTHADVARFIRDVAAGKTTKSAKTAKLRGKSIVRGGRGVATRAAGLLGAILSFAVSEGVISSNPAVGVKKPGYQKRTRRLTPDEYAALGKALNEIEDSNQLAAAAVRLLALTGCRKGEVLGLKWSEVDEPGRAFRLADTKEGASVRPIGSPAFAIIKQIDREDGLEWVLPGPRRNLPYGGLKGFWRRVIERAELTGISPHTLRHSFASVAGDLGFAESTIAALLGHAAGSVTGRYTHVLDAVLVAAAEKVSATIASHMLVPSTG